MILKIGTLQDYFIALNRCPSINNWLKIEWDHTQGQIQYTQVNAQHLYKTRHQAKVCSINYNTMTTPKTHKNTQHTEETMVTMTIYTSQERPEPPKPLTPQNTKAPILSQPQPNTVAIQDIITIHTLNKKTSTSPTPPQDYESITSDGEYSMLIKDEIRAGVNEVKDWISRVRQSLVGQVSQAHKSLDGTITEVKKHIVAVEWNMQIRMNTIEMPATP